MSYRFLASPRWIVVHLIIWSAVALMIWAAFWQLGRLDERRALNTVLEERAAVPAALLPDLLDASASTDDVESVEWRSVEVRGSYGVGVDAGNQQRGARLDLRLVTLADQSHVIVARGRYPEGVRPELDPDAAVQISGVLRVRPSGGPLAVDMARLVEGFPESHRPDEVRAGYVQLQAQTPPVDGVLQVLGLPERDEGPHLGYAGQWCIFAFLCALGYVLMIRRTARQVGDDEHPEGGRMNPPLDVGQ